MKIEIWSDILCPFCYIGKRHLEAALKDFSGKDNVEIQWRSFQLDPEQETRPGMDVFSYLAERKGISKAQSEAMHTQVTQMAARAGLEYHFEKAVVANSFDAHRLLQYAKTQGQGDAMKERLLAAYFCEGQNIADFTVLADLAKDAGLDRAAALAVLNNHEEYAQAVRADIQEAQALGISGVPFFVIDRKYAVSGAQPVEVFLRALEGAGNVNFVKNRQK